VKKYISLASREAKQAVKQYSPQEFASFPSGEEDGKQAVV